MSREYRICHRPSIAGGGYSIHEVYFKDNGEIDFYSKHPTPPFGDIPDELYLEMTKMMDAFDKEPINLDRYDRKRLERKEQK